MTRFLFGGTFDPPHLGHSRIVELLLRLGPECSTITVLPSGHPPAKNPPRFSFAQRVALCELAFLPLDNRVNVSRIEGELAPPSYFINTLAALRAKDNGSNGQKSERYVMVIGFDQLRSLHSWHRAPELFAAVDIWVVDRSQESNDGSDDLADRVLIEQQLARFGVTLPKEALLTAPLHHQQGTFRYVPFAEPHSSTAVRRCLKEGKLTEVKDWLHPDVYARLADPHFLESKEIHGSQRTR